MKTATTETTEIHGIEIGVEIRFIADGKVKWSIPTEAACADMRSVENAENWKFPTSTLTTFDAEQAARVAHAMDYFYGGHEWRAEVVNVPHDGNRLATLFSVSSKGYYHYIGA